MSKLSAQCDELRSMSESVGLAMPQAATLMMEAADTIERLREQADDLDFQLDKWQTKAEYFKQLADLAEADNAKLREDLEFERSENGWAREFLNRMAEHCGTKDCPSLVAYVEQLESQNAKLRELAVLQSVIFKHMSTCPTTDCQACPVNDECAKSVYLEGVFGIDDKETSWLVQWRSEDAADVRAENAKLRELLLDVADVLEEHTKLRELAERLRSAASDGADNARDVLTENTKLRKLLLDVWNDAMQFDGFWDYVNDDGEIYNEDELPHYYDRMRELGIEVNE